MKNEDKKYKAVIIKPANRLLKEIRKTESNYKLMELKGGIDPKLVISKESWNYMTPELQARITYESIISIRGEVIDLTKKIDKIINNPGSPCAQMEKRIEKLEKWKIVKTIGTIMGSIAAGFGGSHIPK